MGLAVLALLAIQALAPTGQTPNYPMVVATKALDGGSRVGADDVRVVMVAQEMTGVARDVDTVLGEHLVAPVEEGAPILATNLLDSHFLNRSRPGRVIAAVPIADAGGLAIVQPGVSVNLYAPPGEFSEAHAAELLARDVVVAGIAEEKGTRSFLGSTADTRVFYLEVPQEAIDKVVGVATRSPVHAVLSGPSAPHS